MNKIPVWMDCDTGVDDAVALLLASASDELDLLAASAVCGNTPQDKAYRNTRCVLALAGHKIPVYRGAKKPLFKELQISTAFHGENGLGDAFLPECEDYPEVQEAMWDALYACALSQPHELRLVATGPLTNVATAFIKYPELPKLLHSLCIMGGSTGPGNIVPAAEFNIFVDPQAAEVVFRSGVRLTMFGLDVTLQVLLTPQDMAELAASGTKTGRFVCESTARALISSRRYGIEGVSMHDSCPVMYLAHPELFSGEEAGVVVETRGTITNGKTVTDLYSDKQFPFKNATVMLHAENREIIRILKERLIRFG